MEKDSIVSLKHVSCKSGYRYLLQDINWNIYPGEHWIVFGMNGSGKTTLLSVLAGFKHHTSGTVSVFGAPCSNETILGIRKRIGWVSSSFFDRYYSKESALNIVLSGKCGTLGLNHDVTLQDVREAKALLTELKLGEKVNYTFDMFSKGERQNILIARALISNPDILILDEPCTGLDVYNRSYLFSTIEELSRKKDLTIIYVTHYVEEITPLFDKTLMLRKGQIFAQGKTEELFTQETLSDLLGFPVEINRETDGTYRLHVATQSRLTEYLP